MPRKVQTGPTVYVPKPAPVQAMRVEPPYKAVTSWCGWEPFKHSGSKIAWLQEPGDEFNRHGRAYPGDYIVLDRDGAFSPRRAADFEANYEKKEDRS